MLSRILFIFVLGSSTVLAYPKSNARIVGGWDAPPGVFPYQASLRDFNNNHFCGASIIGNQWILTTANCVYRQPPPTINVVVGTNYLDQGGVHYGVLDVIIHQGFNPQTKDNDIALLLINGFISYNSDVQPVRLGFDIPPPGVVCEFSGWGLTDASASWPPNNLQHIPLTMISQPACQSAQPNQPVYPTNICTFEGYGRGVCFGDFGGPLVCNGEQQGIASWNQPCAVGSPDVYTGVPYYRHWIADVTGI